MVFVYNDFGIPVPASYQGAGNFRGGVMRHFVTNKPGDGGRTHDQKTTPDISLPKNPQAHPFTTKTRHTANLLAESPNPLPSPAQQGLIARQIHRNQDSPSSFTSALANQRAHHRAAGLDRRASQLQERQQREPEGSAIPFEARGEKTKRERWRKKRPAPPTTSRPHANRTGLPLFLQRCSAF